MMAALFRYGGLALPPALWAANMQAGLILPHADCRARSAWTLAATVLALLLALAAAGLSWLYTRHVEGRLQLFLGALSALTGLAFAFALFLQVAAGWMLDPCLR